MDASHDGSRLHTADADHGRHAPEWLDEAVALPHFEVIDTRSAQGRLDPLPKSVGVADLVLFHGHACDGLLRGAYALRALGDVAFPGLPFDRSDLLVVSKNSPCLGDVAAYLTGGRVRFGTHRLDDSLGVGFIVRVGSTGATWEVREEPGFFPAVIAAWESALLDAGLIETGLLSERDKADLVAINETVQWNWVRTALLPSLPADHYRVRSLDDAELPNAIHDARRTDIVNRELPGPDQFASLYGTGRGDPAPRDAFDVPAPWRQRYLDGPPK
jgi:hypothetical protein